MELLRTIPNQTGRMCTYLRRDFIYMAYYDETRRINSSHQTPICHNKIFFSNERNFDFKLKQYKKEEYALRKCIYCIFLFLYLQFSNQKLRYKTVKGFPLINNVYQVSYEYFFINNYKYVYLP